MCPLNSMDLRPPGSCIDHDPGDATSPDPSMLCSSGATRCSEAVGLSADARMMDRVGSPPHARRRILRERRCEPQVCTPDESICDGSIARLCDSLGSGYVEGAEEDCESVGKASKANVLIALHRPRRVQTPSNASKIAPSHWSAGALERMCSPEPVLPLSQVPRVSATLVPSPKRPMMRHFG